MHKAPVADRADPAGAEHAATNGFDVGPGGKEKGQVGARSEGGPSPVGKDRRRLGSGADGRTGLLHRA